MSLALFMYQLEAVREGTRKGGVMPRIGYRSEITFLLSEKVDYLLPCIIFFYIINYVLPRLPALPSLPPSSPGPPDCSKKSLIYLHVLNLSLVTRSAGHAASFSALSLFPGSLDSFPFVALVLRPLLASLV